MRGLLLAGLRLASGSPVAAERVGGLSLLERAAFVARDAGVTEAIVVAERPLQSALRAAVTRADLGVELTFADPLTERDAILLRFARDEAVAVLRADVAHTRHAAPALKDAEVGEILVDEREGPIRGAESMRLATGPTWVGLGVVRPSVVGGLLDELAREPTRGDVLILDAEVGEGRLQTVAVTGMPWQAVRSAAESRAAERLLVASLQRPSDAWVALHLCRPLSGRVTRLLVDLPVHPIHASVAVFIVGLAGCVAIAAGGRYFLPLLGAVLLAGAAVLAGVDGELARLRYQGSFLGGWLDTAGHDITTVATIMAVTANLGNRGGSVVWTWLGVVGAVCAVVAAALAYAHMLATGTATPDDFALGVERVGAANSPGRKLWGVVARSTAREAQALAVLLGAVIGLLQVATIALFVGSALSCSVAVRRRLQQGRETRKT